MENWEDSEEAKHSAADFHNSNEDVRMAVHGDDFVCLSDDDGFKTHKLFKSKYTATDMGTLEFEESDGKKSSIVCLGFETQASWLRADKSALPVLERPWLEKNHSTQPNKRETPPSDCSSLAFQRWCATLLPTFLKCIQEHKGTFEPKGDHSFQEGTECSTKLKDSDKPTHTQKNGSEAPQITH